MAKKEKAFCVNWYPNDYLSGTMYFSLEEKGGYVELLMLQCNTGRFTIEQAKRVLGEAYPRVWGSIAEKFETDGTHYWNARMSLEIGKRKSYSSSRKKNREGSNEDVSEHMSPHMETETLTGFRKPVLVELIEYFQELGLNGCAKEEAEKFLDHYTSKGWKVGKSPMKDWKASCRNWKRNWKPKTQNEKGNSHNDLRELRDSSIAVVQGNNAQ